MMADPGKLANDAGPLNGIRVLEFCHAIMGPTAGLILADLGADVIKVEPVDGDTTRRLIGFGAGFFPLSTATSAACHRSRNPTEGRDLCIAWRRRRTP